MNIKIKPYILLSFLIPLLLIGCTRGYDKEKTPIHPIPDMDDQPRYKAQGQSDFFDNGSAMRMPVDGTIPQGGLKEDVGYFTGMYADSSFVKKNPVEMTDAKLARGQERYEIFCTPCHSAIGDGKGVVVERGLIPPPSFKDDRLLKVEDGYIYNVITSGYNTMPSYAHQIPVDDRWAIVAHVRELQKKTNE